MVEGRPGLDVSALVRGVLDTPNTRTPSRLSHRLSGIRGRSPTPGLQLDAYGRLFGTTTGSRLANLIGNESKTLDTISSLSLELLFDYLERKWGSSTGNGFRRFLAVPGAATEPPALLILDPAIADVAQSRRLTDEVEIDPDGLVAAFTHIRPFLQKRFDDHLIALLDEVGAKGAVDLLWISQPEIVLTRRPRMVPLSAPVPHIPTMRGIELSTAGVFCRDAGGALGITACFHGTGPIGTQVTVGGIAAQVKLADPVQDIVFIELPPSYTFPALWGQGGVRGKQAPSEAEPVAFEGAGTLARVDTRVKSHDAGILRQRPTLQLKVQTPADTNRGDSGSALIDASDRVLGFAFERTGIGEFPELTDWIWADNALRALGLTPL